MNGEREYLDTPWLALRLLEGRFAVCRSAPEAELPNGLSGNNFLSITRTEHELSIVCREEQAAGARIEPGWRCLEIAGPLAFDQVGILASLAGTLAEAGVSVFVVSTYDTDYLLIKEARLDEAVSALESAGHRVDR